MWIEASVKVKRGQHVIKHCGYELPFPYYIEEVLCVLIIKQIAATSPEEDCLALFFKKRSNWHFRSVVKILHKRVMIVGLLRRPQIAVI